MSKKSNTLSRSTQKLPSLKPKIYQDKFDDKFCTIFFKNHPDYLDLRTPTEKLKCLQDMLESEDLEPGERFVVLSQIAILQNLLHGGKTVESLRAEAELGFFYNENFSPVQALKHLNKAHSLEKTNQIEIEESIKIAVEIAKAHMYLRGKEKGHLQQADKILKRYFYTSIDDLQLRFDRNLVRSRILAAQKNYEQALESYEDARLVLREIYDDNDSQPEAELYVEMAKMLEHARTIPEHIEKSEDYYMKAHKMFLNIGNQEDADKIDLDKLPYDYKIEVMKSKGIYNEDEKAEYDIEYSTHTSTEYETDTVYDIEYEVDFEYEVEVENVGSSAEINLDKAENKSQNADDKNENPAENENKSQNEEDANENENKNQNEEEANENENQSQNEENAGNGEPPENASQN